MADEKNSKTSIASSNPPRNRPRPITTVCTNTLNKSRSSRSRKEKSDNVNAQKAD